MDHDGHRSSIFHLSFFHKFSTSQSRTQSYIHETPYATRMKCTRWNSKKYWNNILNEWQRGSREYLYVNFIHNKSGSIFIYVEMDFHRKKMQNLYAIQMNPSYAWIAMFRLKNMQKHWNTDSLWLMNSKMSEASKMCVCKCKWEQFSGHCYCFVCLELLLKKHLWYLCCILFHHNSSAQQIPLYFEA